MAHAGHGTMSFACLASHCGRCIGSECLKSALPQEGHGTEGGGIRDRRRRRPTWRDPATQQPGTLQAPVVPFLVVSFEDVV